MFDKITKDDLILAFFPCTRFEARIPLGFRGELTQQKNWTDIQKLEYSMQLQEELTELYIRLSQLVVICMRKGLQMVIENPYTQLHYLTTYWCVKPTIIDRDRTKNGDYYKKPTQYWFINCEPKYNLVFKPLEYVEQKIIGRKIVNVYKLGENAPCGERILIGIVIWDNFSLLYPGNWSLKSKEEHGNDATYTFDNKYEVIGNIFDNPELLKGGEAE